MDYYHEQLLRDPYERFGCGCEGNKVETLPKELLDAAEVGDFEKIQAYLNKCCNVNAVCSEESLLSRSCSAGQLKIVERLLQQPEIHLNQVFEKHTPIVRAALNGQTECVNRILNAVCTCQLDLKDSWPGVVDVLKQNLELTQNTTMYVLDRATRQSQWDVVQLLLQTNCHIPGQSIFVVVLTAIQRNKWYIVQEALNRNFDGKSKIINHVLALIVPLRNWEHVQEVLQIKDKELKLESSLAEAALNGNADVVQKLLTDQNYDTQTLNGCLLVVAAGGSSETVVQLLITIHDAYSHITLSDALYLACLGLHSEVMLPLICNSEVAFSFHDLSRAHRILNELSDESGRESMEKFLCKAVESKMKNFFP